MSIEKELKVLQSFYELYVERSPGATPGVFKKVAFNSLVSTNQVQLSTLEEFMQTIEIKEGIRLREERIKRLQYEIKELKKRQRDPVKVKVIENTPTMPASSDGCSRPTTFSRGC